MDRIVMDIRSRKGIGFYVVARDLNYPIAHGRTLSAATAELIMRLDPTVGTVIDVIKGVSLLRIGALST